MNSENNINLISIIIPVYNAEEYISQCLESVIYQSYKYLEIVCIDDCSTDLSWDILCSYAKKDSRVKVYKLEQNSGPAVVRNFGLVKANGEYISFVDADDYIDLDMYSLLYSKAVELDCDIVRGSVWLLYNDGYLKHYRVSFEIPKGVFSLSDCPEYLETYFYTTGIYRTKLFSHKFPNRYIAEDLEWYITALQNASKIYDLDVPVYYYRQKNTSITDFNDQSIKYSNGNYEFAKFCYEQIGKQDDYDVQLVLADLAYIFITKNIFNKDNKKAPFLKLLKKRINYPKGLIKHFPDTLGKKYKLSVRLYNIRRKFFRIKLTKKEKIICIFGLYIIDKRQKEYE